MFPKNLSIKHFRIINIYFYYIFIGYFFIWYMIMKSNPFFPIIRYSYLIKINILQYYCNFLLTLMLLKDLCKTAVFCYILPHSIHLYFILLFYHYWIINLAISLFISCCLFFNSTRAFWTYIFASNFINISIIYVKWAVNKHSVDSHCWVLI